LAGICPEFINQLISAMKKFTKIFIVLAIFSMGAFTKAKAQEIGVDVQLNRPHEYERNEIERPNRPSPRHVWVSEDWRWEGGRYNYHPGYWALPPRGHAHWVPGRWVKREHRPGYRWFPGRWV